MTFSLISEMNGFNINHIALYWHVDALALDALIDVDQEPWYTVTSDAAVSLVQLSEEDDRLAEGIADGTFRLFEVIEEAVDAGLVPDIGVLYAKYPSVSQVSIKEMFIHHVGCVIRGEL